MNKMTTDLMFNDLSTAVIIDSLSDNDLKTAVNHFGIGGLVHLVNYHLEQETGKSEASTIMKDNMNTLAHMDRKRPQGQEVYDMFMKTYDACHALITDAMFFSLAGNESPGYLAAVITYYMDRETFEAHVRDSVIHLYTQEKEGNDGKG